MSGMTATKRETDLSLWLERWEESREVSTHRANSDRTRIRKYILPYFRRRSVLTITPDEIEGWIDDLRKDGVGASTVYATVMILRQSLGLAAAEIDGMDVNPAHGVEIDPQSITPPSPEKIPDPEGVDRIIACTHPHYQALVELAARTGAGWSEAIGLRETDVFLESAAVTLGRWRVIEDHGSVREIEGERADARLVPIPHTLVERLDKHLKATQSQRARGRDWVFLGPRDANHPLRPNFTAHVWRPAVAAAGLNPRQITFGSLRHAAAISMINEGLSAEEIANRLGHRSVTTTRLTYREYFLAREKKRKKKG